MKTKTARSLHKGEKAVLMPGLTEAEPWELWVLSGTTAECVQVCAEPGDNRLRRTTTLALPLGEVFCLPLWLNETDPRQFRGVIALQLEMRGLQPRGQAAVFDWSVVAKEESRTLVLVGILPASLPDEIQAETYPGFDLSARYLPLPEDAITVWREGDRLVLAITRGRELAYFQALAEDRLTARVRQDLVCTRQVLSLQEVLGPLRQVVVWADVTPEEAAALQEALTLPVVTGDRPPPRAPAARWDLVPARVSRAKESRQNRRWITLGLLALLGVYLLFVGWMLSRYLLVSAEVKALRQWQVEHASALDSVHATQAAWKDLRPVVDEKSYPLEMLSHVQQALPADQLHLTLYEANDGNIMIKGEAKNIAAAFQFLDHLKNDRAFASYTWDMAQPHLLPNDLAQFQVEGMRGTQDF